jgi:hypothetical protein
MERSFDLIYAPQVGAHLKAINAKYNSLIRRSIESQLRFDPDVETRNRKPLRRPAELGGADWELRFGSDNRFRVFYDVKREPRQVHILAIGVKRGNRLMIGREEVRI